MVDRQFTRLCWRPPTYNGHNFNKCWLIMWKIWIFVITRGNVSRQLYRSWMLRKRTFLCSRTFWERSKSPLEKKKTTNYYFTTTVWTIACKSSSVENNRSIPFFLTTLFKDRTPFKYNSEQIKSWVTTVWDNMKPFVLSNSRIKREMLTMLIEKMLVNLNNPLFTADFLMESMDTRTLF